MEWLDPLGGWASQISVAQNSDGRLEVFGIGGDGGLASSMLHTTPPQHRDVAPYELPRPGPVPLTYGGVNEHARDWISICVCKHTIYVH